MIDKFDGEYRFLSNFWPSLIVLHGRDYATVEHYFQAMKACNNDDHERIRLAGSPGESKRLGRQIDIREYWNFVRVAIMREALLKKFQIPELRDKLITTGAELLIEGNVWHDNFWGDCSCPRCLNKRGQNLLGTLLMSIRAEIILEGMRLERRHA